MDLLEIDVDQISLSPHQMRKEFSSEEIEGLAASIQSVGLLQPLVVKKKDSFYELISGERRLRAVRLLGWKKVFAVNAPRSHESSALSCLIENVQRVDLNPLEVATAYTNLMRHFSLTQEELSVKIGKKRSTIANYLRLLSLPQSILEGIKTGLISFGHAKAILAVPGKELQLKLYEKVIQEGLSVRQSEDLTKEKPKNLRKNAMKEDEFNLYLASYEEKLMEKLGTRVSLEQGSLRIHWDQMETLENILKLFGII